MLGILLLGASYGALAIPDASAPGSGTLPPRYSQEFVWPDEQGSMPADAELIATKAEISILIEGWPRKPEPLPQAGRPNRKLTVSAALSDLAERYDYTWELSRSGVVLFRKRFSDEHSRPEATHAELRESVRDMLSAIGRLTSFNQSTPGALDLLRKVAESLPPEAAARAAGGGLPLSSLPVVQREQVLRAVYAKAFGPLSTSWSRLERRLAGLPTATVRVEAKVPQKDPAAAVPLVLAFSDLGSEHTRRPFSLFRTSTIGPRLTRPNALSAIAPTDPDPTLLRASSIREAASVIGSEAGVVVRVSPELLDRRIILLLQKQHAANGPRALAEMHGWIESASNPGERRVLRLSRRQTPVPRTAEEIGGSIRAALPLDVARIITSAPTRLEGQPVTIIQDPIPLPNSGPNNQTVDWAYRRLLIQAEQARDEFQLSAAGRDFSEPREFSSLEDHQQRLITHILLSAAAAESTLELMRAVYGLPSYVRDPLNSRLIRQGDAYGIRGPTGGGFMLRLQAPARQ